MAKFFLGFLPKKCGRIVRQIELKNKLKKYIPDSEIISSQCIKKVANPYPNKIWTLWLQGYDQAPPIVKACIDSIEKYSNGREVIILDETNMFDYVQLPEHIMKKYKKGYITKTHFSDILRCALLDEYGGTWMDATLYCSGNFDIFTKDEVMFFQKLRNENEYIMSSYFMHVNRPNNYMIKMLKECEYNYWKKNNKLKDYFLLHLFFTALTEEDKEFREMWEAMPMHISWLSQLLIQDVAKPNNESRVAYILSLSPIHKLTYKLDGFYHKVKLDKVPENTFWNELISPYTKFENLDK